VGAKDLLPVALLAAKRRFVEDYAEPFMIGRGNVHIELRKLRAPADRPFQRVAHPGAIEAGLDRSRKQQQSDQVALL